MTKYVSLFAVAAMLALVAGCDNGGEYDAPATPAGNSINAVELDFEVEAENEITEENVDEALDSLAEEINADDASIE